MNKENTFFLVTGALILAIGLVVVFLCISRPKEDFTFLTQCLAEKNVTMYGAAWCSHCQSQKRAFGEAFSFIPYVECPDNPQVCIDAGIKAYPTWVFPDGTRVEGELSPAQLSELSGCPVTGTR